MWCQQESQWLQLLYLNILVSGADGSEQILHLLRMLLGFTRPVSQHFLEEAVLELEAELQLLQSFRWSGLVLSQQGAA